MRMTLIRGHHNELLFAKVDSFMMELPR